MKKLYNKLLLLILVIILPLSLVGCNVTFFDDDYYEDDYAELYNGVITEKIIEANFSVYLTSYNVNLLGNKVQEVNTQGSAVIFKKLQSTTEEFTYYLLTNNHVVYKSPTHAYNDLVVRDCYGQIYNATTVCYDANYDLAVISFTAQQSYKSLEFAELMPDKGEVVISMGQPLGVINAVTIGKIEKFVSVSFENSETHSNKNISNVQFEVVKHTAPINSGSSGGALLDDDYEICGINYAASIIEGEEGIASGYAIPLKKVKEFLNLKFYVN